MRLIDLLACVLMMCFFSRDICGGIRIYAQTHRQRMELSEEYNRDRFIFESFKKQKSFEEWTILCRKLFSMEEPEVKTYRGKNGKKLFVCSWNGKNGCYKIYTGE